MGIVLQCTGRGIARTVTKCCVTGGKVKVEVKGKVKVMVMVMGRLRLRLRVRLS